jgi:cytochrome P450
MPAYSLHRNPDYFSHPDQFLPQRWLPESKFEKHDTSAFTPFSLGPANCVGQKFAKREIFMVLSLLFKSFDLRFAEGFDSDAWPKNMQDFFVLTRGPLLVNLTPRQYESYN